jgi:hypothetical protein
MTNNKKLSASCSVLGGVLSGLSAGTTTGNINNGSIITNNPGIGYPPLGGTITIASGTTITNTYDVIPFANKSDIEDLKKDIFNLAVNINLLHRAIEELNEKNKNL